MCAFVGAFFDLGIGNLSFETGGIYGDEGRNCVDYCGKFGLRRSGK
jgi:hypothetical protein